MFNIKLDMTIDILSRDREGENQVDDQSNISKNNCLRYFMCLKNLVHGFYGFQSLKLEGGKGTLSIQYTSLPASFAHNNMPGHVCKLPLFMPRQRIATPATSHILYTSHP